MDNKNSERRNHHRFSAPGLSILLKSLRSKVENTNSVQLFSLDFNRFGMAVQSQHNFKIGDEMRVVISDGLNKAVEVACFVCNRAKLEEGYRCGLHFMAKNEECSVTRESLIAVEQGLGSRLKIA